MRAEVASVPEIVDPAVEAYAEAHTTAPPRRALRAFNDAVAADGRVVCVQLTVRDGVTLVRRAGDAGAAAPEPR